MESRITGGKKVEAIKAVEETEEKSSSKLQNVQIIVYFSTISCC